MTRRPVLLLPFQQHLFGAGVWIMKLLTAAAAACVAIGGLSLAMATDATATRFDLRIPREPLDEALRDLARQTGVQVGHFSDQAKSGLLVGPLQGSLSADSALSALLKSTGLSYRALNHRAFIVGTPAALASAASGPGSRNSANSAGGTDSGAQVGKEGKTGSSGRFRLGQVDQGPAAEAASLTRQADSTSSSSSTLEEVLVTGTHLRGVKDTGSEVQIITQADIQAAGITSVSDLISRLPAAFGGDVTTNTLSSIRGGSGDNFSAGSGIDLRGLGATSTLILVNGHRLAPSDAQYEGYVDVSLIPIAAIERVEIVPDGASAIYGSDAVGGVVNFILRRNFDGAESSVRYGSDTEGTSHDMEANQLLGHTWETGSVLVNYEYEDRTPLSAADRDYTASANLPFTLLPEQRHNSVLFTANEQVLSWLRLSGDGFFAERSTYQDLTDPFISLAIPAKTDEYGVSGGASADLAKNSTLSLNVTYNASTLNDKVIEDQAETPWKTANTSILSTDVVWNTSLASLPGGPLSAAVGMQYRRETLDADDPFSGIPYENARSVAAAFTEFGVPIVGPAGSGDNGAVLELTAADRYEHYSDFGSTNNPKVGLTWRPVEGLKFRSTFGTSFRAPELIDLNPTPSETAAGLAYDPTTNSERVEVSVYGGNPNLKPEKARTWSAGLDCTPTGISGLQISGTYYNIHYTDRIENAETAGYEYTEAFELENILGPQIVQRNPPLSLVEQYISLGSFYNGTGLPGPLDPSSVAALVYFNEQNLAEVNTSGVDFNVAYTTALLQGTLTTGIEGTYIFQFENRFLDTTPFQSIVSTPFNPVNLKFRAKLAYTRGSIQASVFANYVNSYTDNLGTTPVPVASWTTFDASVAYRAPDAAGLLKGVSIMLSALNLTNRAPPYVQNVATAYGAINFDGTNANPLGRFVSLTVGKRW